MPLIRVESFMDPPVFFSTLTSSISTSNFSPSFLATETIELTMMSARKSESFLTSFVCIDVFAIFFRMFLSLGVMFSLISERYCFAFFAAFL